MSSQPSCVSVFKPLHSKPNSHQCKYRITKVCCSVLAVFGCLHLNQSLFLIWIVTIHYVPSTNWNLYLALIYAGILCVGIIHYDMIMQATANCFFPLFGSISGCCEQEMNKERINVHALPYHVRCLLYYTISILLLLTATTGVRGTLPAKCTSWSMSS